MPKRNVFKVVSDLPWPVGVSIAIAVWVCFRYALSSLLARSENLVLVGLAPVAHDAAPILTGIFLVAAGVAAWRTRDRRRLLDSRSDLASIQALSWERFEHLVGEVFRRRGYTVVENSSRGADRGIDLVLTRGDVTVLVQCKRWRKAVGVPVVRELLGAITAENASGGILVASSRFTDPARAFARANDIELVDGTALQRLIHDVQTGAGSTSAEPAATNETRPPASVHVADKKTSCPKCQSPMVRRTRKKSDRPGEPFLGCTQFPACRGTRSIR